MATISEHPATAVRVAVAQLRLAPGALEDNRRRTVQAIEDAAARGASLVVLPELASSGYRLGSAAAVEAAAEPIPGPTTDAWQRAAAATGCFVVGGICERRGDDRFNSVAVVGPDGVLAIYRKLHLFDQEQVLFQPGDAGLPVVDLPFGRIGVLVCYDLRFVEALRVLALQGADLVAVPTAWTGGFDPTPPADGVIDQVRAAAVQANLDGVFVAAASTVGQDGDVRFLGSSCVVDPYGRFVLEPCSGTEEAVEVVDVDLDAARRAKVRAPRIRPLIDRRTDVYAELLGYDGPGLLL
jgi:predicted amidohydrolase